MPPEQEESSVDRIKKQLSMRNARSRLHARRKLYRKTPTVEGVWHEDDVTAIPHMTDEAAREHEIEALRSGRIPDKDPLAESMHMLYTSRPARKQNTRKHITERLMRSILVASVAFFLVSAVVAVYVLFFSDRQVSCNNIRFEVRGPTSIPSGSELTLNTLITNNNKTALQNVELVVEYPDATRNLEGEALRYQQNTIGSIAVGESTKYTAKAILNGREQDQKSILSTLRFNVEGSNFPWECTSPFLVTLATAPITIAVDALNEISSGQEMVLRLEVTSNSEDVVPNARLAVSYPYGFEFVKADPKPTTGDSVWDLGDVNPNKLRTIEVRGIVTGFTSEQKSIGFELGEGSQTDPKGFDVLLQTMEHTFAVTQPFISTELRFDDDDDGRGGTFTITPGDKVAGSLVWKNMLNETLYDVEVRAVLPDIMVDRRGVTLRNGFFRSDINTMLWTPQTEEALKVIEPGETGELDFSFETTPFIELTGAENPAFSLSFDITARRIANAITVEQSIQDQSAREIRFMTMPTFETGAVYSIGPFTNTGPHPPAADTETTYTIVMKVKNTINDLRDVQVMGELPVNVTWLNEVYPGEERVTFNPVSRKVIWDLRDVVAGAGYRLPEREASFRISIIPSTSQIGTVPPLFSDVEFRGIDSFTQSMLQKKLKEPVDTRLLNDPFFPDQTGYVRE